MDVKLTCPQEFEIRQPRWFLIVGLIILAIVIVAVVLTCVNIADGKIEESLIGGVFCIIFIFFFMAAFLLLAYFTDTFRYSNGEFYCRRFLHPIRRWNITEVDYVIVNMFRGAIIITFWNKNNHRLAYVTDANNIWDDGRLRTLLYIYNIPLKGNALED